MHSSARKLRNKEAELALPKMQRWSSVFHTPSPIMVSEQGLGLAARRGPEDTAVRLL